MADQTLARYVNELGILTILRTHGPASRADLARRLSVTPATITRLITRLSGRELVHEVESSNTNIPVREPGRPGVNIALNPSGAFFLGVEIGVGIMRFSLLDLAASCVASSEMSVSRSITPPEAVRIIARHAAKLERTSRFHGRIQSGGITVPGLVTIEGHIVHLPILGWKNVNLLEMVRTASPIPWLVENNANAAAFGSVYSEKSASNTSTVFLKLGTGCGGAAIVDGRLLRGSTGTAGELGHIKVTERGHACSCGQSGCLESWVNLRALARAFRGTDDLTDAQFAALPAKVLSAAERGDARALASIDSLTRYLGMGIVSLVNIFNPATIMLGGVLRPVVEKRLESLQQRVAKGIVPGGAMPEIRLSGLGLFECSTGAATLAHYNAFDISRRTLPNVKWMQMKD